MANLSPAYDQLLTSFLQSVYPPLTSSLQLTALLKLGITVICTFAMCWMPCMKQPSDALLVGIGEGLREGGFICILRVYIHPKGLYTS